MTKEDFVKSCLAEFHCTTDSAECWCSWADTLHEYYFGYDDAQVRNETVLFPAAK